MSFRRWQTLMTAKISRTVLDPLSSEVSAVVNVLLTASLCLPIGMRKRTLSTEIVSRFRFVCPAGLTGLDGQLRGSYLIGKALISR